MVKWLMTGPFSQLKQKSSGYWREEKKKKTGGAEITSSETKGLEQFPKDKLELRNVIDK